MAGQIKVLLFDQITVINGNGVRIPFLKVAKAGERIEPVICLCVTDIKLLSALVNHDEGKTTGQIGIDLVQIIPADQKIRVGICHMNKIAEICHGCG